MLRPFFLRRRFIASHVANKPFRGQESQQTRLEQPCLRSSKDR